MHHLVCTQVPRYTLPWLCTYIKHGSVTESDSSCQLIHSLSCSFFFLVSNESRTDIADAARQARRGKAKMGVQSVFQTPFFFFPLFFFSYSYTCALDNELLLLLIIIMIPHPASSFDLDPGRVKVVCVCPCCSCGGNAKRPSTEWLSVVCFWTG